MKQVLTYSLFISLSISMGLAQKALEFHIQQPMYASGEVMGFFLANTSGIEGEVLYVEMMDKAGKIIDRLSLSSKGTIAHGQFEIPLDIESDWYMLRAFSLWMPSTQVKDLGYAIVPVYNVFDQHPINAEIENGPITKNTDSFQVNSDKENYWAGEMANVGLSFGTSGSWILTSVLDEKLHTLTPFFESYGPKPPAPTLFAKPQGDTHQEKLLFLGKMEQDMSQYLGAFYVAEDKRFDWVSFSRENAFGIEMDTFEGKKNGTLLGVEALGNVLPLKALPFSPSQFLKLPTISYPELPFTQEILNYLAQSRQRKIIEDVFEQQSSASETPVIKGISFGKPDRSYSPREYIQFNNLPDFIKEVAGLIRLRKNKAGYNFRVFLEGNVISSHTPLLFLNGYLVDDVNILMETPLADIDRIDIYRRTGTIAKNFPTIGRNGVVAFHTKDPLQVPANGKGFEMEGFQTVGALKPDISGNGPSFSPTLLWSLPKRVDASGEVEFSFEITHDRGTYVIEVFQVDAKSVKMGTKSIMLKPKS